MYTWLVQDPNPLWQSVQSAKTYPAVINRANRWLEEFWDQAYELGFSPKGTGKQWIARPSIIISEYVPSCVVGWYHLNTASKIKIVNRDRMLDSAIRNRWPVLDWLRDTIVHETQHTLDWDRGVDSSNHNTWYVYRLRKLTEAFPPDQL